MSRISYSEDEDYPGQFEIWQANCRRSLHSRAGVTSLRELEEALLALPDKRLGHGVLVESDGEVCAIGAAMVHRKVMEGLSRDEAVAACAGADPDDSQFAGERLGFPSLVAWKVVEVNDIEFACKWEPPSKAYPRGREVRLTPEERYLRVLGWVREHLSEAARERAAVSGVGNPATRGARFL